MKLEKRDFVSKIPKIRQPCSIFYVFCSYPFLGQINHNDCDHNGQLIYGIFCRQLPKTFFFFEKMCEFHQNLLIFTLFFIKIFIFWIFDFFCKFIKFKFWWLNVFVKNSFSTVRDKLISRYMISEEKSVTTKTANINVLLNRVKLDKKRESRKKILFSAVTSAGVLLFGILIF